MDWYVIVSESHNPAWNLSVEECILDCYSILPQEALVLFFYVNDRSIIIGKHQNPWLEVSWDCIQLGDPPVFRRISGGGTVYHDQGNLNFSFIQPRSLFSKEGNLSLIQESLRTLGIEVSRTERGDLFYQSCKVSGNALCYRKDRVLHHGTLLIDADLKSLRRALTVPSFSQGMFRSPAVPSVGSNTANLKDSFPFLSTSLVIQTVIGELSKRVSRVFRRTDLGDLLQVEQFQRVLHRHASWDWVFGATPSFWFNTLMGKSMENGELSCKVEKGRIVDVRGMEKGERLLGHPFDPLFISKVTERSYTLVRRDP
ncbi:MAG: hypothetical protein N2442_01480 [Spirochaetes bacterium]|nr:hypothetical protein [Spirochaetota bacterium]